MSHVTSITRKGGKLAPVCGGRLVQRQGTYTINAQCSCGWSGRTYQVTTRTPIGYFAIAERDGLEHVHREGK